MQDYCGDHVEITSRQYRVLYSDSAIRVRHRAYTGSFFALLLQTKLASPVGCRSRKRQTRIEKELAGGELQ